MPLTAPIDAMPLTDIVREMHALHDTAEMALAAAKRHALRCRRAANRNDARDHLAVIDDQCRTLRVAARGVDALRLAIMYRPHVETAYADATTTDDRSARSAAYGDRQHATQLGWRVLAIMHRIEALRCDAEARIVARWPWREASR